MLRSMFSAVAGLKTHQTKMDVIGNNIANVNTYGFKSSRVTFRDVYYQTLATSSDATGEKGGTNAKQIGYGSMVGSIDLINTRSGYASTGKATDCYIAGEGYFVLKDSSGNLRLTRVGQMDFDGVGNLTDPSGNFVCGYPVSYYSGQAALSGTTVDFGEGNGSKFDGYNVVIKYAEAAATESVTMAMNSDTKTLTITYTPPAADAKQRLTNTALQTALQDAANWTGLPADVDTSLISILETTTDPGAQVGATTALVDRVANFDYTIEPEKIVNTFGQLVNIAIGSNGVISGQTQAGEIVIIGQLALANVPNPQALILEGNSYFKAGNNTGVVTYAAPGDDNLGSLQTSGLEMSNVDLSNEFSDMIMTQRGFQANSKIITVSDEMLETLVNLKR